MATIVMFYTLFLYTMIDIKDLRARPDYFRMSTAAKGSDSSLVDKILVADEKRRETLLEKETLRSTQKTLSAQIPQAGEEERGILLLETKKLSDQLKVLDEAANAAEEEYTLLLCQIPNPIHQDVVVGSTDEDNKVLRFVGDKPEFDFEPKEHWELAEDLDLLDMERGAKISGSRFYYMKNDLVLLQYALIQFTLKKLVAKGFTPMIPPYMVRQRAMFGTGYFPDAENGVYIVNPGEDDLYLIGTSEVPLVNYHDGEMLDLKDKPLRYVGVSPCFRREAGSYGKDTKGILRVHQFEKVEMVSFCNPEHSYEEHEYLREVEEEILQDLQLPYQVLDICSGDLGGSAAKKYDLEAWMPGQGKYREVTSTSNTTDYQSRRLSIRHKNAEGNSELVHILNGTATSMRPLIAIMEVYQQKDGSIKVPEVLVDLMGKKVITKTS